MTTIAESPNRPRGRAHELRHLAHVVGKVTALNFRARMEYRADFVISVLFGIIWQTSTLMFALERIMRKKPASGVALAFGPGLAMEGFRFGWSDAG